MFPAVIGDALEVVLGKAVEGTTAPPLNGDGLRTALVGTAEAWEKGMIRPVRVALRHLVVNEIRRFPELCLARKRTAPAPCDRRRSALQRAVHDRHRGFYALVLYSPT
ncbi:hypothetical protein [Streptomyces sp. NPDC000229]|uniref:hypothetical protein n=1 Tax=Streptomyces sp. NPDC000229 TaxID=3154247 RepID=UPI0033172C9E